MRQFYCEYVDKPNLQSMIGEISWTKNLVIFGRCKDDLEREFYLRATARYGWTTAVLKHQVDNKSYEKYLLNQTNFDATVPDEIKAQAMLAVKDHYTFDFLDLADQHSERDLEQSLVKNLRAFLSELRYELPRVRLGWQLIRLCRSFLRRIVSSCLVLKKLRND